MLKRWRHRKADQPADYGAHPGSRPGQSHEVSADADHRYLAIALGLIVAFMAVEVAVAFISGSLVLLADAGHMLTDAGAIAAAMVAARLAARPPAGAWTYGLKRAEVLSTAGNGVTLLVVALLIGYQAIFRLISPEPVPGLALVVMAVVGVVVNLVATLVLAKANRSSMNIEGAFQHILTDLYAFIGTAIAGLVILFTGWERADPVASLVVVALMLWASWGLLRTSGRVLMEAAPSQVDLDQVRAHLLGVPQVEHVHDLHVSTITSGLPVLTAHIVVTADCFTSGVAGAVLDELQTCLEGHFDVAHSTFQLEPAGHSDHEPGAHE